MTPRVYTLQDEECTVLAVAASAADAIALLRSDMPGEALTASRGPELRLRLTMDEAIDLLRHGWSIETTDETGLSRTAQLHEVFGMAA